MSAKRVLLISMPFTSRHTPSLGLSLLKGALERDGIACDIQYFSLMLASLIGTTHYDQVADVYTSRLLGEWLFAEELYGDQLPPPEEYFSLPNLGMYDLVPSQEEGYSFSQTDAFEIRSQISAFMDRCMETVNWREYALVGFTTVFEQNNASLALARRLKEQYPHLVIIFGGANCEGEMGAALHRLFPFIDYVCSGEGDINFPILARRVLDGEPVGEIAGIIRRENGLTILPVEPNAPVMDLDSLPYPGFDDFFAQREAVNLQDDDALFLQFETSRGCWWGEKSHCTFCGLNGATMNFRSKSPARALDEISFLAGRYRTKKLHAVDNIMDLKYIRDVLPGIRDLKLPIKLFYETKSNLRKEQVQIMREAGVYSIQPGIESLSTETLRLMRKGVSSFQNIQLLRWCAEFVINPVWLILYGFPGEDPREYDKQAGLIPLITHLTPPILVSKIFVSRFSPYYNTPEVHGICNVRAAETYKYAYPFNAEDLNKLASAFDFDYKDGRDPETYIHDLKRETDYWRSPDNQDQLFSVVDGDALVIRDTRRAAKRESYQFTGIHRAVYEYCDQARSRSRIKEQLNSLAFDVDEAFLNDILSEFIEARLMIEEDGQYLSLAVDFIYRVRLLEQIIVKQQEES